jgi:hypothetical protein
MNLLFCACPVDIYGFFTSETYPDATYTPIPAVVDDVPDYTACTNKNKCSTVKARHAILSTTCADIITMNVTLVNVFLNLLSSSVRASYQQRHFQQPNVIFVELFD